MVANHQGLKVDPMIIISDLKSTMLTETAVLMNLEVRLANHRLMMDPMHMCMVCECIVVL